MSKTILFCEMSCLNKKIKLGFLNKIDSLIQLAHKRSKHSNEGVPSKKLKTAS